MKFEYLSAGVRIKALLEFFAARDVVRWRSLPATDRDAWIISGATRMPIRSPMEGMAAILVATIRDDLPETWIDPETVTLLEEICDLAEHAILPLEIDLSLRAPELDAPLIGAATVLNVLARLCQIALSTETLHRTEAVALDPLVFLDAYIRLVPSGLK
jgi:hypothetical protein